MDKAIIVVTDADGVREIKQTGEFWPSDFLAVCQKHCPSFDSKSEEALAGLDDGVLEFEGKIVSLIWLDENGNYDTLG